MHWFILGRESLLSAAEIAAVTNAHPEYVSGLILKLDKDFAPDAIKKLGGTIKIGREIASGLTTPALQKAITTELKKIDGKIQFGVSIYSLRSDTQLSDRQLGLEIKKMLKAAGKPVRFVEGKNGVLNAAQIKYNRLIDKGAEFLIEATNDGQYNLAKTVACQDVDEFSARDYGRPGRDDLSGMLPPKLAMIMINLAQIKADNVLLDPFCGSGTILTEAGLMGYQNLIGTDISAKAIADTKQNIEWFKNKYQLANFNYDLYNIDAAHLSNTIKPRSVDAVVSEPYLGRPLRGRETEAQIRAQIEELKKLYLLAFGEFRKILKPNGNIIFIIPRFKFKNDWLTTDIKNGLKKAGFMPDPLLPGQEFILYARAGQSVGREIWKFKLS